MTTKHNQNGALSLAALLFLSGILAFVSFAVVVIVSASAQSKLLGIGDAALYSASDSDFAQRDSFEVSKGNTPPDSTRLADVNVNIVKGNKTAHARVQGKVDAESLSMSQDLFDEKVVLTRDVETAVYSTTLEIVVMLDVSDSMSGKPMEQAKKALQDFAEVLYANARRNNNRVISIVPSTGMINIGHYPQFFTKGSLQFPVGLRPLAIEQGWRSFLDKRVPGRGRDAYCPQLAEHTDGVVRASGVTPTWIRLLERSPKANDIVLSYSVKEPDISEYRDGTELARFYHSQNRKPYDENKKQYKGLFDHPACGVSRIQPLMTRKKDFLNALDTLYSEFDTNNAEGVLWAWRLLSPEWRGLWDRQQPDLPRAYSDVTNRKVMLLFTDGENTGDKALVDKKQIALCREMRRKGIQVVGIDFNHRSGVVQACASDNMYFKATNRTIRTVLQNVAHTLDKIELTQ